VAEEPEYPHFHGLKSKFGISADGNAELQLQMPDFEILLDEVQPQKERESRIRPDCAQQRKLPAV
jgi:hypothetical protein